MDFEVDSIGLSLLSDPDDAVIDIVFVHGLQGHPHKTWSLNLKPSPGVVSSSNASKEKKHTLKPSRLFSSKKGESPHSTAEARTHDVEESNSEEKSKEIFWPRDLLVADIPQARIMTFGYDTNVTRGFKPVDQGNIFSHAKDLLYALEVKRRRTPDRDLVFIAHSLGGILVKEVLRRSGVDPDPKITKIFLSTTGVFFFGTPHRGSKDWASFGEGVANISKRIIGIDVNPQVVHALLPSGPELELCRESFITQWWSRGDKLTVRTFQESKGVTGIHWGGFNQLIVPPDSSTLDHPHQRARTIDRDHMQMVKFYGRNDKSYEMVKEDIAELADKAKDRESTEKDDLELTAHLAMTVMSTLILPSMVERPEWRALLHKSRIRTDGIFERMSSYDYQRAYRWRNHRKLKGTTGWILNHTEFLNWLSGEGSSCLWLSGIVGSGKSIIMTTVIEACYTEARGCPVLHFIYDYSFPRHRTASALFASYTKQLLVYLERNNKSCPKDVIARILEFYGHDRHHPDASELIEEILLPLCRIFDTSGTTFLVDGVDECSQEEAQKILNGLRQVLKLPRSKVFISCRQEINVLRGLPGAHHIWIDMEDTKADLQIFVNDEIEACQHVHSISEDETVLHEIRHEILQKTQGMFLWAHYLIKMLWDDCVGMDSSSEAIYENLKRLPKDLNETYQRCLARVEENPKRKSLPDRILKWICVSPEPFKIKQLQEALAVNPDTGELGSWRIQKEELVACCANLAFIQQDGPNEILVLAHHSVRQFLFSVESESHINAENGLGELCISYLYWNQPITQIARYSHGTIRTPVPSPMSIISTVTSTIVPGIFRARSPAPVRVQIPIPAPRDPDGTDDETFLSFAKSNWLALTANLLQLSRYWLQFKELVLLNSRAWEIYPWNQRCYHSFNSHIHVIYSWSIVNSHYSLLSIAIGQQGKVKENIFTLPLFNESGAQDIQPLQAAVDTGDIRICERILELLPEDRHQRSYALQVASEKGFLEIVRLLGTANGGFKYRTRENVSPLRTALQNGHNEVVQYLLDKGANRCIWIFDAYSGSVTSVSFSPDGSLIAIAGGDDKKVRLWDMAAGVLVRTLNGHWAPVSSVVFSPDGKMVASGGRNDDVVRLWNVVTGKAIRALMEHEGVSSVAFSPDSSQVVAGYEDGSIILWTVATGKPVYRLQGHHGAVSVAFSLQRRLIASGGASEHGLFRLWDAATGESMRGSMTTVEAVPSISFSSVAFSPDSRMVAIGGGTDRTVRLWNGTMRTLGGHAGTVSCIAFSPNGELIASGGNSNTDLVRVWDAYTGEVVHILQEDEAVTSVAFSPDSKLLAVGYNNSKVRIWVIVIKI